MRGRARARIPPGYSRARVLAESATHVLALAERKGAKHVLKIARGDAGPVQRERAVLEALGAVPGVSRLEGEGGDDWIALAWVDGPTLEERIARRRLTGDELARLGARLDGALSAIARLGYVHGDVKPANVILPRGRLEDAVLVDFETAARVGSAYSARVTTSFAAPERLAGDARADPRADAFSLGALLFACVVGASPFAAESREASVLRVLALEPPRLSGIGDEWASAVAALLAKDAGRRPTSLADARARRSVETDDAPPPSSLRDGIHLEASSEPWGSIAACLRAQFSIGEPASFDAIVRVMEPKMLGAGRARARRLASVIAELLGAEPTAAARDALDAIRADAALLSRMRREAVLAALGAPGIRRGIVMVAAGADEASVEIARAVVAAGIAQRLEMRPTEARTPRAVEIAETPALVALAAWGTATAADLAGALDVPVGEVREAIEHAVEAGAVVKDAAGRFRFTDDASARALLDRTSAVRSETLARVAPAFAARFPQAHARAARLFDLAGQPLRAAYYAWRAARGLLQASQLERAHDVIELGRSSLERAPAGQVRALLAALLDVARAQLLRWSGDLAGSMAAARAALASLPAGSAEWCESLGERATAAGKTNDASELLAVASALRQRPERQARLAWDRACARTAVQLFYQGRRREALALVRLFTKETTLPDGSPDDARRGLSPGALVTASLYAGRLDEHLERLEDAVRAFRAIGDVRSECLYGSAIGFALSQLGAYDRAERRLRRTVDIARKSGVPVLLPLTLHNLGEVLSHDRRTLREALDVESQAVDELRAEGESRFLAGSLAYRARIHVGLGELDAAERDAHEALDVGASNDGLRALLFGTLADVMLARGRNDEALASARTAADAVKTDAPAEAGDALAMATLVRALEATGARDEARRLARFAWRDIVRRSKRIATPALRASFLRRVPEHRVIMDAT